MPTDVHCNIPGNEAAAAYGNVDMAFAAFLELGEKQRAEISIPTAAYAEPSGPVSSDAFERIADRICEDVANGCDTVYSCDCGDSSFRAGNVRRSRTQTGWHPYYRNRRQSKISLIS